MTTISQLTPRENALIRVNAGVTHLRMSIAWYIAYAWIVEDSELLDNLLVIQYAIHRARARLDQIEVEAQAS